MGFTVDAGNTQRIPVAAGESVTVTTRRVAFVTAQSGLGLTPGSNIGSVSQGSTTYGPYPAGYLTVLALGEAATVRNVPAPAGDSNALIGLAARPSITLPATAGSPISGAFTAVGNPTPTSAVQWLRDGVAISGATAIPYASQSSDAGKSFELQVTISNSSGTLVSKSDPVVIAAAGGGGGGGGSLRQAVTGTFLPETLNGTAFHGATSAPFTNKVALATGTTLSIKFTNMRMVNGVETNGAGTFTLKGLAVEYGGSIYPATLTKAQATGGETAEAQLVLPADMPAGIIRLNYAYSDGSGLRLFPWYTHTDANPTKQQVGSSAQAPSDQVNVLGGGTLTQVAAGQSFIIVPTAIDAIHANKVAAVFGSSSGPGRNDGNAPGAGIQGYITRGIDAAGYAVKNLSVSGQQAQNMVAGMSFITSQLYGVSHVAIVVGGNDLTQGSRTSTQVLADLNTIVNNIKTAYPAMKVAVVVLTPVTTGTWDTVAGQTQVSSNGLRTTVNARLLDVPSNITNADKIINVNTVVENVSSPEDGRFKAPPQLTSDGTHLNSVACTNVALMPDWADFMAL